MTITALFTLCAVNPGSAGRERRGWKKSPRARDLQTCLFPSVRHGGHSDILSWLPQQPCHSGPGRDPEWHRGRPAFCPAELTYMRPAQGKPTPPEGLGMRMRSARDAHAHAQLHGHSSRNVEWARGRAVLANFLSPADSVVSWYFYRLQTILSYKISTVLPLLYSTSLWLTYFITASLYLLIHCTCIIPASNSSPVVISLFSVTGSLFLSCYFLSCFIFRFCMGVKTNSIYLPLSGISLYLYYFTSV